MTKASVLVVEDDEIVLRSLVEFLKLEGHTAFGATTIGDAERIVTGNHLDLVLTDVYLQDATAFQLLERIRKTHPRLDVILMTGYGTIEDAIKAIRAGASNYVTKPLVDAEIRLVIEQTLKRSALEGETEALRAAVKTTFGLSQLIANDPEMTKVVELVEAMAKTRTTVLLTGESGTGKTMLARALHYNSERASGPFVEVACGALTESLLESELFGHEAGAFTGATHVRKGKFEAADGGTIFLDEIATASPQLQVKLLRVLQDGVFERVGGTDTIKVDARIVLATNVDLTSEVANGRFREDLFYRINVMPISVPPLRKRRLDIPLLAEHFIRKHASTENKKISGLEPDAMEALVSYNWPGNVRELENAIERCVVLSASEIISRSELPADIAGKSETAKDDGVVLPLKRALEEPERRIIERALHYAKGSRDAAAKMLGINRSTLFYKMRKLGLTLAEA